MAAFYRAFLSYSHAADGKLASALQRGIQRLGKPWWRRPVVRVFRDETSLSADPGLWSGIQRALEKCEYFLLMASAQSAASPWVQKEVEWWFQHRSAENLLIIVTEGRDRLIDDQTEDCLERAYRRPITHRRTRHMREQAWLVMVILQDCGMRPDEVFPMRIENVHWESNRIWIPEGKTKKARRFVAMSERVKTLLQRWCGDRREGWVFASHRSKSGHLTTIAKGFQAARERAGLDKKLVPYSARHTYGTYTMERSGNAFAVAKSMGHVDLKSMEPYQHQELEPLREIINQRNQRKKFSQVFGQVLENEANEANDSRSVSA
jgi:integrase